MMVPAKRLADDVNKLCQLPPELIRSPLVTYMAICYLMSHELRLG
jgi:hypothetical protein